MIVLGERFKNAAVSETSRKNGSFFHSSEFKIISILSSVFNLSSAKNKYFSGGGPILNMLPLIYFLTVFFNGVLLKKYRLLHLYYANTTRILQNTTLYYAITTEYYRILQFTTRILRVFFNMSVNYLAFTIFFYRVFPCFYRVFHIIF